MAVEAWELTEEDRDRINNLLSSPLDFPLEFKSWILDQVAMNVPPIPIEQLQGYVKTRAYGNSSGTSTFTATSTSFADYGGPSLSGLPDGVYLVLYGTKVTSTYGRYTISVNGGAGTDAESVYVETGGSVTYSGVRLKQQTLNAGAAGNTIGTLMRKDSSGGAGDPVFTQCWLVAIRMS